MFCLGGQPAQLLIKEGGGEGEGKRAANLYTLGPPLPVAVIIARQDLPWSRRWWLNRVWAFSLVEVIEVFLVHSDTNYFLQQAA